MEYNKSVFSFLLMLTRWHCPHSSAASAESWPCSNRLILPVRLAHSIKPAATGTDRWTNERTDRQMDEYHTITWTLFTYYAGSDKNS